MIAVIGGGSWATALVKILLEDGQQNLRWWVRRPEMRDCLATTGRNPYHLTQLQLNPQRFIVSCDLAEVVSASDLLVLAIPSVYVGQLLGQLPKESYRGKRIISAIKGYLPELKMSISQFATNYLHIPSEDICVVSGPSHAEEVAVEKPAFLTVASSNQSMADEVASLLRCHYIHTDVSNEVYTIELCGLTKNIYAIAAGLASGLGYGDNLIAVLTTAAAHELQGLLPETALAFRLLSDLIVTCFSHHSRNRALGEALAHGTSPEAHFRSTGMVAEGYYSSAVLHQLEIPCPTPIAETVYSILYEKADPRERINYIIDNIL